MMVDGHEESLKMKWLLVDHPKGVPWFQVFLEWEGSRRILYMRYATWRSRECHVRVKD